MENLTDSMSSVASNDGVAERFGVIGDNVTKLTVHGVGLAIRNSLHQGVVSGFDELTGRFGNLADTVSLVQIAMVPIDIGCHIKVHNVAFLQGSRVGNSVANDLIDGSAAGSGECVVVQRRGVAAVRDNEFVNNFVNFLSSDSGCNNRVSSIEGLSRNSRSLADAFDHFFSVVNGNLSVGQLLEVAVRLSRRCVVRLVDSFRHLSFALERVSEWPQRSSVERRVLLLGGIRFLMEKLVEFPESCETLLSAEVGGGELELDASGALHGGFFAAVWGSADVLLGLGSFTRGCSLCISHLFLFALGGFHCFVNY